MAEAVKEGKGGGGGARLKGRRGRRVKLPFFVKGREGK